MKPRRRTLASDLAAVWAVLRGSEWAQVIGWGVLLSGVLAWLWALWFLYPVN